MTGVTCDCHTPRDERPALSTQCATPETTRFRRAASALFAAVLFPLLGCSHAGDDLGVVVRDSAGIRIVENRRPAWQGGRGWRVAREPSLTIGVLEGPEEYQLFRARSAIRLDDGRIVVANAGSSELRFYDSEGRFLVAVGGEGEGPGEFSGYMGAIWRAHGDSMVVYDYANGMRLSVFDENGTLGRSFRLDAPGTAFALADDLIWGTTVVSTSAIRVGDQADGPRRDSTLYRTHSLDGALLDTLGRFPGDEIFTQSMGEGNVLALSVPFGRRGESAAAGDYWYFGSSDRYEIHGFDRSGRPKRILRRDVANRAVTRDLVERLQARTAGTLRRDIPIPETMPAYGRFLGDPDGNLWVQEYRVEGEPERWAVIDASGRLLGIVELPAPGRVTEIGGDYVLGVWTDDLDVEQVRLYALHKNR